MLPNFVRLDLCRRKPPNHLVAQQLLDLNYFATFDRALQFANWRKSVCCPVEI
jgi:hypothetical protein